MFFFVFALYGPKTEKKKKTRFHIHAKNHDPQRLHGQKCEVRFFVAVRTQFFFRVNGPKLFKRKVFEFDLSAGIKNA